MCKTGIRKRSSIPCVPKNVHLPGDLPCVQADNLVKNTIHVIDKKEQNDKSIIENNNNNNNEDYNTPRPGLWLIHGKYYDLAKFQDKHPGGFLAVTLAKGRDCTHLFEQYHINNENHRNVLKKYEVDVKNAQPIRKQDETLSAFHADIKIMLKEHFAGKGKFAHKAKVSHWFKVMGCILAYTISWYGWWQGATWSMVTLPWFAFLIMVNWAHDGSHMAISSIPIVNEIGLLLGAPLFYTHASWYMQHVVGHHIETNNEGDPDIHHHPFTRWSNLIKHPAFLKTTTGVMNLVWHATAFLTATVNMSIVHPIKFIISPTINELRNGKVPEFFSLNAWHKNPDRELLLDETVPHEYGMLLICGNAIEMGVLSNMLRFGANIFAWLWSWAVLTVPFMRFGFTGRALALATVPYLITGILFMIVTQVSHVQPETQKPEVIANPDFFQRQALTSLDYSVHSHLWCFLTGGLNVQSIHHVMPGVNTSHYTDIYPKYYEICQKHKCAPTLASNVNEAMTRHLKYIYELGEEYRFPTPEM